MPGRLAACAVLLVAVGCRDGARSSDSAAKEPEKPAAPSAAPGGGPAALDVAVPAAEVEALRGEIRELRDVVRATGAEVRALRLEIASLRGPRRAAAARPAGTGAARVAATPASGTPAVPAGTRPPGRGGPAVGGGPADAGPAPGRPAAAALPREQVNAIIATIAGHCRAFRYSKALAVFKALKAQPLAPADRQRLAAYEVLVGLEAGVFRLASERIRTGKREATLSLKDSPAALVIRDATEEGLTVSEAGGGEKKARVEWSKIPPGQQYRLMLVAAEKASFDERLALTVFAHHRGLEAERGNELKTAESLAKDANQKEFVRGVRAALIVKTKPNP